MVEVESMATQGHVSRPGAWSFPDCTEIGTAGQSTLTWEESKANLALFAVTSSPLILGVSAQQHCASQAAEFVASGQLHCDESLGRALIRVAVGRTIRGRAGCSSGWWTSSPTPP